VTLRAARLVLEYFPGCDLSTALANESDRHFTEEVSRIFFTMLMQGVAHIHSMNIVHRDIHMYINSIFDYIYAIDTYSNITLYNTILYIIS